MTFTKWLESRIRKVKLDKSLKLPTAFVNVNPLLAMTQVKMETKLELLEEVLKKHKQSVAKLKKILIEILTADNDDPDGFAEDVINEKFKEILGDGK